MADGVIKTNPARSKTVTRPGNGGGGNVIPWADSVVSMLTDSHPARLQLLPVILAGCGLRINEALALAAGDVDLDAGVVHVRRQIKKLGKEHIYALPKSNLPRDVPLPDSVAAAVRVFLAANKPWPCTLPWEKVAGKAQTHLLLFQWTDGSFVRYRTYSELVWKRRS